MNNYKVLSKDINNLSANEAYIYSLIKYYEDFKTHKSEVTEAHLAKISGLSESGVKKIINKLKDSPLMQVETVQVSGTLKRNYYHFSSKYENYFYVDNEFFKDETLDATEKGLLLKLKCLCKNDTNKCWNEDKLNKSKLAEALKVSRPTLNKYLQSLIDKGQVLFDKELVIVNKYIYSSCIKNDIDEAYKVVVDKCNEQGVVAPDKEYFPIANILSKWSIESLEAKLNNLPKNVNWEYITKIFGVRFEHKKHNNITYTI